MRNKPRIRFKGFMDDWEQHKLGETFEYLQNNTLSRDSLNYKNPNVKNIHYGDILVKFDEILDGSSIDIPYINSEFDLSKFSKSLLRDGDIIFSDTAEDDTVGKAIELQNVNAPFILSGLHTIPCRPLIPFGKGYLGNFLNSNSYRMQLRPLVQGIKVSSISKSALKDTMIEYPINLDEQEKIGSLFQNIAKMITLHQRKIEKLKLAKKALLQKLFPKNGSQFPEIRFKDFTDAWEQRKLGECVDISTGYPFDSQDFNENGEYLVITNGNIQENTPFVLNNVGNRIDLDDSLKKYILDIDDLLITMDGTVGRVAIVVDNKLVLAQRVCRIKSNEPYYIYQVLSKNDFIQSMNKIGHGGTIKHISLSEISEYQAYYPKSQKERIKISNVLTNCDKLITLHQRKLDKLQDVKKGLLQKMFV